MTFSSNPLGNPMLTYKELPVIEVEYNMSDQSMNIYIIQYILSGDNKMT